MKGFIADLMFEDGEVVRLQVSAKEIELNTGMFRNLIEARVGRAREMGHSWQSHTPCSANPQASPWKNEPLTRTRRPHRKGKRT